MVENMTLDMKRGGAYHWNQWFVRGRRRLTNFLLTREGSCRRKGVLTTTNTVQCISCQLYDFYGELNKILNCTAICCRVYQRKFTHMAFISLFPIYCQRGVAL